MEHGPKIRELMEKGDTSDSLVAIIDEIMAYRHQPYSEILKMPVPLVEKIFERIQKEKKELARAMEVKK